MGRYFVLPSPEIQRKVNEAFGSDQYARLAAGWLKAVSDVERATGRKVPTWTAEQQTRLSLPEQLRGVEGRADPTSGHYIGLQRDIGWSRWPLELKRQVAASLEAQGFAVERTRDGRVLRRHLHYGVSKAEIRRRGLVPLIEGVVGKLRAAGAAR